jgi:hypothetical protein
VEVEVVAEMQLLLHGLVAVVVVQVVPPRLILGRSHLDWHSRSRSEPVDPAALREQMELMEAAHR